LTEVEQEKMENSKDGFRKTRIPVEYKAKYLMGDIAGDGFITDISEDGIALRTRQVLIIGDKLTIQSEISDSLTFEFNGEVRNVQGNLVGVIIQEIDPEIKQRFLDHIDGVLRLINRNKTEHYVLSNK
jgi:hypothetical protein